MPAAPEAWVTLGRIAGIYGVRGWLRVHSYTDPRAGILDYPRWWLGEGERREYELTEGRRQGAGVVASLAGVGDREAARSLIGAQIAVPRGLLPPTDGYYQADLIGLAVENRDGVALGRVSGFIATGTHDVVVIEDGTRERLIPYAPGIYVDRVTLAERRMVVDWNPED
jgi:16S rRNA processing protein RimM